MKTIGSVSLIVVALGTVSCGGSVAVGFEPGAGGAGGTTSSGSAGKAGTGGAGGATAGSAGQAGATPTVDAGPMVDTSLWPTSRCGFPEQPTTAPGGPTATGAIVLPRITAFLQDAPPDPSEPVPALASAAWASSEAATILDRDNAGTSAPNGLARFLETWLKLSATDGGVSAPRTWAARLVRPDATLATLFTGPTGNPQRKGVFTDLQFLTAHRSISTRGTWMSENVFCMAVPPVPPNVPALSPRQPNETRREWLTRDVASPSCQGCHKILDPLGWSLEHFDPMGAYSDTDTGKPVDSSGTFIGKSTYTFTGIDDFAPQLATSCEVAQCFTKAVMNRAFNVANGAMPPYTDAEVNHVANRFADAGFSIRELVKGIVETPSFLR